MGQRRSGCEDRRLPVACAQLTATRIHDQEVTIEEGGEGRGERGESYVLEIECDGHSHFIYVSGGSLVACVTASVTDSRASAVGGQAESYVSWNPCNGRHGSQVCAHLKEPSVRSSPGVPWKETYGCSVRGFFQRVYRLPPRLPGRKGRHAKRTSKFSLTTGTSLEAFIPVGIQTCRRFCVLYS
jgi:hypothetical protein